MCETRERERGRERERIKRHVPPMRPATLNNYNQNQFKINYNKSSLNQEFD